MDECGFFGTGEYNGEALDDRPGQPVLRSRECCQIIFGAADTVIAKLSRPKIPVAIKIVPHYKPNSPEDEPLRCAEKFGALRNTAGQ